MQATAEFKSNGLDGVVTVTHRDIEVSGFPQELHGQADAVFLDLPGPWKVCAADEYVWGGLKRRVHHGGAHLVQGGWGACCCAAALTPAGANCACPQTPPSQVVPSAASCLRYDGTFCSFSPCIEQVRASAAAGCLACPACC